MDLEDLMPSFSNLQLQTTPSNDTNTASRAQPPPHTTFNPFTRLPIELRRKIYTHAHPTPTTIHLTIRVIVADPSYGLYFVFSVPKPRAPCLFEAAGSRIHGGLAWLRHERAIALLHMCREARECYLERFPIELPSAAVGGGAGKGRIRISREDLLYIPNYDLGLYGENLANHMIYNEDDNTDIPIYHSTNPSLLQPLHLQNWVTQLTQVALPLDSFDKIPFRYSRWQYHFVTLMVNVECFRVVDSYRRGAPDEEAEAAANAFVRRFLDDVEEYVGRKCEALEYWE